MGILDLFTNKKNNVKVKMTLSQDLGPGVHKKVFEILDGWKKTNLEIWKTDFFDNSANLIFSIGDKESKTSVEEVFKTTKSRSFLDALKDFDERFFISFDKESILIKKAVEKIVRMPELVKEDKRIKGEKSFMQKVIDKIGVKDKQI